MPFFKRAVKRLVYAAGWFVAVTLPFPVPAAETNNSPAYKFGAFPMIAVGQIDKVFSPVAAELAQTLGQPVHFRTKPTFDEFRQELSRETYDFAVVQPFDYVLAHDSYHYLPLARFEDPLRANIMVLSDSALQHLQDLKGATLALPPITAATSRMAKKALKEAGFDLKRDLTLQYTKSLDSCLQLVVVKAVSACVSSPRAVHIFESTWGQRFRTLFETPSIPNTLFVVHRRVPKDKRDLLLKTLTSWPGTSEVGREFIKLNNMRLVPAHDAEYNAVRRFPAELDKE
ncbi:MAG: phosphate/phosphite/phosphonate ABC transporter substrate-binding protein [Gammaproteobacteria bacterium]|nr:phosphate/phosphite/phosphonate ABC transporter substrate-binding protein [Gammaproteobacteria bacterium]